MTTTEPKPVLENGHIYSADNGRLICRKCAGASALYTGRDISGQKVTKMTDNDNAYWFSVFDKQMQCEGGCTTFGDFAKKKG